MRPPIWTFLRCGEFVPFRRNAAVLRAPIDRGARRCTATWGGGQAVYMRARGSSLAGGGAGGGLSDVNGGVRRSVAWRQGLVGRPSVFGLELVRTLGQLCD